MVELKRKKAYPYPYLRILNRTDTASAESIGTGTMVVFNEEILRCICPEFMPPEKKKKKPRIDLDRKIGD